MSLIRNVSSTSNNSTPKRKAQRSDGSNKEPTALDQQIINVTDSEDDQEEAESSAPTSAATQRPAKSGNAIYFICAESAIK